ncbi:mucin-2-like [Gadus chalcogrammus]|uniref:mucin-2-like n=1 Tax=Gadus chalcogrammus TaxID=1042646 RepID=UPI0024C4D3F5|nr:mucin-2-like [Gadus chalcogrammus]
MARLTLGLSACSLLLLYLILESKESFTALAGWRPEDIPPKEMLRQKRATADEATFNWTYLIDIKVNGSSGLIAALNNISLPVQLNNITQISEIQVTTACTPVGAGEQCRCQEGFAWPIESCLAHGACDVIAKGVCSCINGRPADGQSCQPIKSLQAEVVLEVEVELHLIDLATLETLRARLENSSFPLALSPAVEITDTNITTVCSPFGAGFQCTCEDPYRWPCDKCLLHGSCDNITDETCGCINALPPDEEYCQLSQLINTTCPITTSAPPSTTSTPPSTSPPPSTTSPPPSTSPPVVYEYLTTIELQTTNVTVIEELRSILDNISYPFPIDSNILISEVNITTVCSPFGAGFQCTCEDPYRWPCDKCLLHGSCDNITDETCGCINALPPDEEYCQLSQLINTTCPITTSAPPSTTSTLPSTTSPTPSTTSPPPSTSPPVVYEYLTTIELQTTNVTVIEELRSILDNISYPFPIDSNILISEVNITTVCSPFGAGFQCTCEDPYRWPCDKCLLHGSCDNITDETCGCINALPPDEEYCQLSQLINTTCPITTSAPPSTTSTPPSTTSPPPSTTSPPPSTSRALKRVGFLANIKYTRPNLMYLKWILSHDAPVLTAGPPVVYEYLTTIELQTTNVTVIEELRSILDNISYPFPIDSNILISEVNITTVCSPFGAGFQCTCEDPYRWPCVKCLLHGSCDNITDETCGCINALPPDEEYCQLSQLINTTCPITTSAPPSTTSTPPSTTSPPPSTTSPPPSTSRALKRVGFLANIKYTRPNLMYLKWILSHDAPVLTAGPPVVYVYLTTIELQTTNVTVIEELRSILDNNSYPFPIDSNTLISEVNITTVCSPFGAGFQCTCEDPYRWPCDKCLLHGSCDNITDETCGCINALPPDEEYCQLSQLINTTCPITTSAPPSTTSTPPSTTSPPPSTTSPPPSTSRALKRVGFLANIKYTRPNLMYLKWILSHDAPVLTAGPPVVYVYLTTIELQTTNVTVIEELRSILDNISYPFPIDSNILISEVNITTVCSRFWAGFQCRCEDPYRWPCDKCLLHGSCDNMTDETCGCINALPPDEEYCQQQIPLSTF